MQGHPLSLYLFLSLLLALPCWGGVGDDGAPQTVRFRPAIVFNSQQLDDNGFNAQLVRGIERFEARYGHEVTRFISSGTGDHRRRLEAIAEQGFSPILVPSSSQASLVTAVAPKYPATTFVTLDFIINMPNVHSVAFRETEVAYLAGMAASSRSQTGRLGFLGGQPNPALRKYRRGFEAGARAVNPDVLVEERFLSQVSARPWNDPEEATRQAAGLMDGGVDVLFAVAGNSGQGAMIEARRRGALVIGVDANQNGLYPGTILTSAVKRLDEAVYVSLINERYRLWSAPHKILGLAQGGLSLAIDEYSQPLLGNALIQRLRLAERKIVLGVLDPDTGYENSRLWTMLTEVASHPDELTLVLSSEEHYPQLVGTGSTIRQDNPGLLVDALQMLERRMGVGIHYVRQPRRRGLVSLQKGLVDALVSVTDPQLPDAVGRLPGEPGPLDSNRALLMWNWALYRLMPEPASASGGESRMLVAAPTSSSVVSRLRALGFDVFENPRLESRFEMLLRGRVSAVADYDVIADYLLASDERFRGRIDRMPANLGQGISYLVFSNQFYARYPEFCELMWNQLSEIRESAELWDKVSLYLGDRSRQ